MRTLALLLALVLAPQAALASVAAFPETALRGDREISAIRVSASAKQLADGRQETVCFYDSNASAMTDDPINHRDPTGEAGEPGDRMAGIFTGLEMSEEHAEQLVEAELYRCQMLWGLSREVCATIPSDYASGVAVGSALKGMTAADIQNAVAAHVDTVKGVLGVAGLQSIAAIVPIVPRARTSGSQSWRDMLGSALDDERPQSMLPQASPLEGDGAQSRLLRRSGPRGLDPEHHNANVMVRDDGTGEILHHERFVSGDMTPAEKALGYPLGQNASHTEARATSPVSPGRVPLSAGQTMTITGQLEPCPSCKGYMNRASAETGATIRYQWREDGKTRRWIAKPPRLRR